MKTTNTAAQMIAQPSRSLLTAAVLAVLLYLLVRHFFHAPDDARKPRQIKKGGQNVSDSSADKLNHRKPYKGTAPQKIDVFTQQVCAAFPDVSAEAARRLFPRKFEVHGHVVVVRLNEGTTEAELQPLASYFAAAFFPVLVDVVLLDVEGIVGELRQPSLHILYQSATALTDYAASLRRTLRRRWGDARKVALPVRSVSATELETILTKWTTSPTYTTHVENGVLFSLDVSRVMFSSGNTTERMHFATVDAAGETVVDMFCGIGYFTLPLAMNGKVRAIYALEKNPDSVDFIKVNAVLNRVDHVLYPICGDNRVVGDEAVGKCDRVLMGYIPTCKSFLPRALSFLKRNEAGRSVGAIHYHFLADKPQAAQEAMRDVREELGAEVAAAVSLADLRCVKSYAPKRFHYVADLVFS
ncbi:putative mitochondrial methionine biosynthetic protein [Leptomonas pyrrhocoris]|uniref:Putative mitochondrial methionine biosynthetic protein n=1 Tax=Leptomonas pyrrhocoris TaxID=157538 RepID=A0A0N0DQW5_LEPPY|nr:putative mitochondrial methionine biosynthetic protein [Leptomonas pyrrhocoris]XP_015652011.1 putative mitochondrial methionine biosynthetic protein [Leptomonas pyrrhocoris]KPA73571.1 putative mitochondrial methionine biosynthetic protein [Leptomonas pyrrhocoris]KPA73572.1 putative mitochondrial methionine biosynthetic protein [Leptomonas pyrrhocoris]|eukprot:XP_015652010.1 putative mitochondrial methionine biosynthetic protein [Leptomonas pyrrhocoris]